jgi:hypothetical protein
LLLSVAYCSMALRSSCSIALLLLLLLLLD